MGLKYTYANVTYLFSRPGGMKGGRKGNLVKQDVKSVEEKERKKEEERRREGGTSGRNRSIKIITLKI